MKNEIDKLKKTIQDRIKVIFDSHLTAKQIAINAVAGVLIGLLVPMGFQTIAVIALCPLFKLNFLIVVSTTLITNPFTFIFIYYSAFRIGDFLLASGITWENIYSVLIKPEFESIINLSLESIKVIYTGLIIETILLAPLTYLVIYQFARYIKNKKN
jgi:uncharacterized protein (DUF2062 family)